MTQNLPHAVVIEMSGYGHITIFLMTMNAKPFCKVIQMTLNVLFGSNMILQPPQVMIQMFVYGPNKTENSALFKNSRLTHLQFGVQPMIKSQEFYIPADRTAKQLLGKKITQQEDLKNSQSFQMFMYTQYTA